MFAGVAHAEEVIAWTSVPLRDSTQPASHTMRSLPLFHLPIVVESEVRFPLLGDAMLKCYFHETACKPGATSLCVLTTGFEVKSAYLCGTAGLCSALICCLHTGPPRGCHILVGGLLL